MTFLAEILEIEKLKIVWKALQIGSFPETYIAQIIAWHSMPSLNGGLAFRSTAII